MTDTVLQNLTSSPEGMRLYQQERAILELTELVCELMDELGVSRAELARRLSTSRGYVTRLLDGSTNMTLRKITDVFSVLDRSIEFRAVPMKVGFDQLSPLLKFPWVPSRGQWPTCEVKGQVGAASRGSEVRYASAG
jgi:AraC-like DNA-binding protein